MKLTIFIITTFLLQVSASSLAQNISIKQKNITLKQAFNQIRKQTGYDVLWQSGKLNDEKRIDVNFENVSLKIVLDETLHAQNLTYSIVDKTIVIKQMEQAKVPITKSKIQLQEVTGTVMDTTGVTLPGASVLIKGTKVGTQTDRNGKFSFPTLDENTVLVISFTGYITQEVSVKGRSQIKVVLKANLTDLEAVSVVAFGTQRKSTMVGSVTSINPKELKGPTSNLTTMLAGRVAGVIAYQRSGEPGRDNADFFIRGVTTFGTGKRDPLILINGIEMTASDLSRLQPDDIAGFSILKDATASSLYGARGANGVVLVTTKSGVSGKTKFNIRLENSLSSNTKNFQYADNITYMKLANEATATRDPLGATPYLRDKIERTTNGENPLLYPNNNWIDLLIKNYTNNQRLNMNVSGGSEKAQYYIAGTMNVDNGVLKTISLNGFNSNVKAKNYEIRSNINVKLTPTTEAIVRTTGQFNDYNGPTGGGASVFQQAMWSNPVMFPAAFSQDLMPLVTHPLFGNALTPGKGLYNNPYANMLSGFQQQSNSNMIAQLELKQDFNFLIPGLSARMMAYTRRNSYFDLSRRYSPFYYTAVIDPEEGFRGLKYLEQSGGTDYLSYSPGTKLVNTYNYLETSINYNQVFQEKHEVSAMLISILSNYITANAGSLQASLPSRNQGVSGRFTYGYESKYLAEFNFGYNGSERFYVDRRYGFFPSVGLAWNVSKESFFERLKPIISKMKLRGTYGLVGNDQIGSPNDRFFYLSNVNMNDGSRGYTFGDNFSEYRPGIGVTRYENKEITWEKAYKTNFGIELSFFNDINLEIDIYKERRTNILMTRAHIPATMGLSAGIQANVGEAEGKGMDAALDYSKSFNSNLWMTVRGNFTYAASKLLINEEPNYPESQRLLSQVGYSLSQKWGLIAERYFVDENEVANSPKQSYGKYMAGDIKYRDMNGDGQVTDLDKVPLGFPQMPEITYGFGLSLGYKGFDFGAFFQGSARSSFWIDSRGIAPFAQSGGFQNGLLTSIADNHWSEDNRDLYAFYPRLSDQFMENNHVSSSWWMRDGSFLRLKTVELGYSVPDKLLTRLKLSNLRIYSSAMNLFSISKFKMWDVEMGGNGIGYPIQRVMNIGVNIGF